MKKQMICFAITAAWLAAFTPAKAQSPQSDVYTIDLKTSSLGWNGKKMTGEHNGIILFASGELKMKGDAVTGGVLEIDMNSIQDTDMTGEYKGKLEGHLKSEDFFDAGKFPKAKFEITSATPVHNDKVSGFTHTVKGNLTLKGKTNEIGFDAVIKRKENKVACVGTATIDRSKFDVKYGSKTFFEDIGDKIIYDDFTVKFNVVAVK